MTSLRTIVELPEFLRRAKAILTDDERTVLVDYIAANPEAGVSLRGGLRKVRIPCEGGGKSGGYRTHLCPGRRALADLRRHRVRQEREGQPDQGRSGRRRRTGKGVGRNR